MPEDGVVRLAARWNEGLKTGGSSRSRRNSDDIQPSAECSVAGNARFTGRDEVTAEPEVVADSAMIGEETLRMMC